MDSSSEEDSSGVGCLGLRLFLFMMVRLAVDRVGGFDGGCVSGGVVSAAGA